MNNENLESKARMIVDAVVDIFMISRSDLVSRKRDDHTALARQVAMYLIWQDTDFTLAEIGRELGGRSPATVTYAYQKIAVMLPKWRSLRGKVEAIRMLFESQKPKTMETISQEMRSLKIRINRRELIIAEQEKLLAGDISDLHILEIEKEMAIEQNTRR